MEWQFSCQYISSKNLNHEVPFDINCAFTLTGTETDTDTDTDKMCTYPDGNLYWYLSQCNMNTSTQFYLSHILSVLVLVLVLVSGSVNIP